ncbi:hypothetical protein IOD13_15600 [Brevibacterium casei]|nr:hypothetical protein [Brevibacterium casei]
MARRAERAIVVADSSKCGRRSFASVGGTEVFEEIITDDSLGEDEPRELTAAGYAVDLAPTRPEGERR